MPPVSNTVEGRRLDRLKTRKNVTVVIYDPQQVFFPQRNWGSHPRLVKAAIIADTKKN
jgi:hypothetical protein